MADTDPRRVPPVRRLPYAPHVRGIRRGPVPVNARARRARAILRDRRRGHDPYAWHGIIGPLTGFDLYLAAVYGTAPLTEDEEFFRVAVLETDRIRKVVAHGPMFRGSLATAMGRTLPRQMRPASPPGEER
jgi:hypothetical protein